MTRKTWMAWVGWVVAVALSLGVPAAVALEGAGDSNDFEVFLRELPNSDPASDEYFRDDFQGKEGGDGWSFGDRAAYACAFIEHYTDNVLDFEIHYELLLGDGYQPGDLEINDRFGQENIPDGQTFCGDGQGPGATLDYEEGVHGDHFPHGDFFQDEQVSDLVAYRDLDGDGFVQAGDEINRIDYSEGDSCDQWYWTPGRDANAGPAAIGWWDEDGPSSPDGHQQIGCPDTGPTEPNAAILVTFQDMAPGVVVCVNELEGPFCVGGMFGDADVTPPTTTISCDGSPCAGPYTDPVTVTLAAIDDQSGVASTVYSIDGTDPSTPYSGAFVVTGDVEVRYRSTDVQGNVETVRTQTIDFLPVVHVGVGPTQVECPDGSAPTITSTDPLRVSCP
jgi:hypothetical protein